MQTEDVPPKVRHTLDLASKEINRQKPDDALEQLKSIRNDLERTGGSLAAEHRLLLAEAFAAKGDPVADCLFAEALQLIANLEQPHTELELRANEHFGDYLVRFAAKPSTARRYFETGNQIAIGRRLLEDSARIQLKMIPIDLQTDRDPHLENFRTFKRAASQGHFTSQVQLAAWHQFLGQVDAAQCGIKFARNRHNVSEAYFNHLLESVRVTSE